MLTKPLLGEVGGKPAMSGGSRSKPVGRQRVRHARVRVAGDEAVRLGREFFEEGPHLVRPERAVQADGQRLHMPHGIEIGLGDLAGNHRLTTGTDSGADLHGQLDVGLLQTPRGWPQRGLGIERVENGLHHQRIHTTGDQGADLVFVGRLHLIEGDVAEAQVGEIGELRERHGQRADGPGDVAFAAGLLADLVRPLAALLGGLEIDLPGQIVEELVLETSGKTRVLCALAEKLAWAMLVAEKVFVSMMSAPASRKRLWMSSMMSGPGDGQDVAIVEQVLLVVRKRSPRASGLIEAVAANRGWWRAHGTMDR
jgi:hypothetical protein